MGKNESSTDLHMYIATFPWYIQEMQNKNYHTDHKSNINFCYVKVKIFFVTKD